jgi:ParB/RepB/Spo0J family partition protein
MAQTAQRKILTTKTAAKPARSVDAGLKYKLVKKKIDEIEVVTGRAQGNLRGLIHSLKLIGGLIYLIITRKNPKTGRSEIIDGRRRFEALKRSGVDQIDVIELEDLTDDQAALIEIDSNLQRKQLTLFEEAADLRRRKELIARMSAKQRSGKTKRNDFASVTAELTHKSKRRNEMLLQIDSSIPDDLKKRFNEIRIGNELSAMLVVARLRGETNDPTLQRDVAEILLARVKARTREVRAIAGAVRRLTPEVRSLVQAPEGPKDVKFLEELSKQSPEFQFGIIRQFAAARPDALLTYEQAEERYVATLAFDLNDPPVEALNDAAGDEMRIEPNDESSVVGDDASRPPADSDQLPPRVPTSHLGRFRKACKTLGRSVDSLLANRDWLKGPARMEVGDLVESTIRRLHEIGEARLLEGDGK